MLDQECKANDVSRALDSLHAFRESGALFREFSCHMGLLDMTHVIRVKGVPVAMLISGQYRPRDGLDAIHAAIDAKVDDESVRRVLHRYADELPAPPEIDKLRASFEIEALHIEKIAEREYDHQRSESENDFLQELEQMAAPTPEKTIDAVRVRITLMLDRCAAFLGIRHILLFAAIRPQDTVLQPIAWTNNISEGIARQLIFNWRKGLRKEFGTDGADDTARDFSRKWRWDDQWRNIAREGVRGQPRNEIAIEMAIPAQLIDGFRAILVMGPLDRAWRDEAAHRHIRSASDVICQSAIIWLQALHLDMEREAAVRQSKLVVHRARQGLQKVEGIFGTLRRRLAPGDEAAELAIAGEGETQTLAKEVQRTLKSSVIEIEPDDLVRQEYSMAALVENVIEGLRPAAQKRRCTLNTDLSLEMLGYCYVDPMLLGTALINIVENAIKYSHSGREVRIWAEQDLERFSIFVEDIGEPMPEAARRNLIAPGQRWSLTDRGRQISGMGFGLWDASIIVTAHEGHVDFSSVPLSRRDGPHTVQVWITLPWTHAPVGGQSEEAR